MAQLRFRAKGWLERDGSVVAGSGRVRLLQLIDEHGSISAAAREMGMSYRYAWGILRQMEDASGMKIVRSNRGGRGGNTTLTDAGKRIVREFHRGMDALEKAGLS